MAKEKEAEEPIDLYRVEERIERVPLTPEQVQERMHAAATILLEAIDLDRQTADLKESAKSTQKRADAKHEQVNQIVLDAQSGTAAAPYPVIVERHPGHLEMVVWRVPDGVDAGELLSSMPSETDAQEYFAEREAQGCVLVEQRAMTPDELRAAELLDHERRNPELPFGEVRDAEQDEGLDEVLGEEPATEEMGLIAQVQQVLEQDAGRAYSARDLAERLNRDLESVRDALSLLVDEGVAVKSGAGRGTKYAIEVCADSTDAEPADEDTEDGGDLDEASFEI